MSKKKKAKLRKIRRMLEIEKKKMAELHKEHPAMFKMCGKVPCCQAFTNKGKPCERAALTADTYFKRVKCCYLCWQHAIIYGVYGMLKIGQALAENNLSWEEYCALYPEKCEEYLQKV